jgi:dTMP kinase
VTAPPGTDALGWIRQINAHAIIADLTIVIDVSVEAAARRRATRGAAPQMFELDDLQCRLAEVYRDAERLVALERLVHVSGEAERSVVAERVLDAVRSANLPIRLP